MPERMKTNARAGKMSARVANRLLPVYVPAAKKQVFSHQGQKADPGENATQKAFCRIPFIISGFASPEGFQSRGHSKKPVINGFNNEFAFSTGLFYI